MAKLIKRAIFSRSDLRYDISVEVVGWLEAVALVRV